MKKTIFKVTFDDGATMSASLMPILADDARAIVHFRPDNWKGEYGFDWFRDNAKEKRDGKIDYKKWIGKYYNEAANSSLVTDDNTWSDHFQNNDTDLETLKQTYSPTEYRLLNKDSETVEQNDYFVPKLALFSQTDNILPFQAKLKLYLEIEKKNKPDAIEFDIPEGIPITIDNLSIEKPGTTEKITITCTDTFNEDAFITAYAVKGESRNEAGKLQVIAPSKKISKKVVIIRVKTRSNKKGNISNRVLEKTQKILKQALITLNITKEAIDNNGDLNEVIIDVTDPNTNFKNIDFDTKFRKNIRDGYLSKKEGLASFLNVEFERAYGKQFQNHFKLFCVGEKLVTGTTVNADGVANELTVGGYSTLNSPYAVLFSNVDQETLAHEMLHGLGLPHTFANAAPFTYLAQETNNMMDYSHSPLKLDNITPRTPKDRFNSWYWQWRIINPNIQ